MATSGVRPEPPLIVIVGPTASGKTVLAIRLAKQYDGEIICADSRTIYRGMDIGTAKPGTEEQAGVPHWGLDLVEPGERFTAADFQQYTMNAITDIRSRDRVPIIVGGTGLYVDGVLFGYEFGGGFDPELRSSLDMMSLEQLHEYCQKNNIVLPENQSNKRYVIRSIERKSINNKRSFELLQNTVVVGIATNKNILNTRIRLRAEQMLTNGVVEEAIILGKKYGWDSEAMTGNVYPLIRRYAEGEINSQQCLDSCVVADRRLAKRQMTWFRRNPHIYWGDAEQLYDYLASILE